MKIFEIATGYTSIPARVGAATEVVVEELGRSFVNDSTDVAVMDIQDRQRPAMPFPILEIPMPAFLLKTAYSLGVFHKLKRVWYSLALAWKLFAVLRPAQDKMVLHFHNQYNFFFSYRLLGGLMKKKTVMAYTVHSYIWSLPWEQIDGLVQKKYFMEIFAMRNAHVVFVLNETIARVLQERIGIPAGKIRLIPNGVNTSVYNKLPAEPRQGKRLVHVGSVCARKNQLGIIKDLLPLLKAKDIEFHFAGGIVDKDYKTRIDTFCASESLDNAVHYVGELKPGADLNEFYNTGDAFIFDSESEAFSLVLLEAMSTGLPVLLHQRQKMGFLEALRNGIRYYDRDTLPSVISQLFNDTSRLAKARDDAREAVVAHYSWDHVARLYAQAFLEFA